MECNLKIESLDCFDIFVSVNFLAHTKKSQIDVMTTRFNDKQLKCKNLAMALSCVAFDVFFDKLVVSQKCQLAALWRR